MEKSGNRKLAFILILLLLGAKSSALTNEIGNPTAPATSSRSGLIKSPNPIDNTSNLVVTGNVSGLAYFHGNVPYSSSTDFGGSSWSDGINSFLRRTAPLSSPTRQQFSPQPYYLPSKTVGTLAPNPLGQMLTYPSIRETGGTGNYTATKIPKTTTTADIPAASPLYDYSRLRPLNYEPADLERATDIELLRQENKKKLSNALLKADKISYDITEKQDTDEQEKETLIPQPLKPARPAERLKPAEPVRPNEAVDIEASKPVKDIYEQMLEEIKKSPKQPKQRPAGEEEKKSEESSLSKIEKQTAIATVGIHESFATESRDKFNSYMRAAEGFLKQGKYYDAADAYTLAGIYKPGDPLADAGRSHALFASGEYMSSAYFLTRAIDIFPQYADVKIDLKAMIPDANRLESRIEDVKACIWRTEAAELNFLLAYIYHQLDRDDSAKEAIDTASEKLPNSAAVKALKQAIDKK